MIALSPAWPSTAQGLGHGRPLVSPSSVTLDTCYSHFLFKNQRDNKTVRKILSGTHSPNKLPPVGILGTPGREGNHAGTPVPQGG